MDDKTEYDQMLLDPYVVNVKDHGAVGDGTTDDRTALQSAFDAAEGRTLYFPQGVYRTSGLLTIRSHTDVYGYGATIRRLGYAGTILGNYEAGDRTTTGYNGNKHFRVNGLTFDGNSASTEGNLVTIVHSRDAVFIDCVFARCTGFHMLEFNSTDGGSAVRCKFLGYIPVEGVSYRKEAIQIDQARPGLSVGGDGDGTLTQNVLVDGCVFGPDHLGAGAPNVCVGSHNTPASGSFDFITIRNCVGWDLRAAGVWFTSASNCVVEGCKFTIVKKTAIHHDEADLLPRGISFSTNSHHSHAQANTIWMPAAWGVCLDVRNSQYCELTGNETESGVRGVYVETANNTMVNGNIIHIPRDEGVIINRAQNCVVNANRIAGAGYPNGARGSIALLASASGSSIYNTISNNVCSPHHAGTDPTYGGYDDENYGNHDNAFMNNRFRGATTAVDGNSTTIKQGNIVG